MKLRYVLLSALLCLTTAGHASTQVIPVIKLAQEPVLDGDDTEWDGHPGQTVKLRKLVDETVVEATTVLVKAGHYGGQVIFYLEWEDSEADLLHKPYVWSDQRGKYVKGPQREDRLAMQFGINGDFDADWLSGKNFTADMWHWKSSRSNPLGIAHDKHTTVSTSKLLRAARINRPGGPPIYVLRENDAGEEIYRTKRYSQKEQEVMPKYELVPTAAGSITDIRAKGVWRDGRWYLELLRKMNTGNRDDAAFSVGQAIRGAISVFDRSENEDHMISDTLVFQF